VSLGECHHGEGPDNPRKTLHDKHLPVNTGGVQDSLQLWLEAVRREQPKMRNHREIDISISKAGKEESATVHTFLLLAKCSGSCCLTLTNPSLFEKDWSYRGCCL